MRAVVELRLAAADEFQIGLVHQRGGIERMPVLAGQLPPRHRMQLLVQRPQYLVQRAAIPTAGGVQPLCDLGVLGHRPVPHGPYSRPIIVL